MRRTHVAERTQRHVNVDVADSRRRVLERGDAVADTKCRVEQRSLVWHLAILKLLVVDVEKVKGAPQKRPHLPDECGIVYQPEDTAVEAGEVSQQLRGTDLLQPRDLALSQIKEDGECTLLVLEHLVDDDGVAFLVRLGRGKENLDDPVGNVPVVFDQQELLV